MPERIRVVFVCLGNICRSPVAEAVMRHRVRERGVEARFHLSSAGLGSWHAGSPPDERSQAVVQRHRIEMTSRARVIDEEDLSRAHWIICMDESNRRQLLRRGAAPERVRLLRSFHAEAESTEVDDPYEHGPEAFERMFREIHAAIDPLIDAILAGGAGPRAGGSARAAGGALGD